MTNTLKYRAQGAGIRTAAGGWSLLELLVVIGVIVILMTILLPILGGARGRGFTASTLAEMKAISTACDSYQQVFGSYPGVFSEADVSKSHVTAGRCISGAQNMLISLLGGLSTTASTLTTPPTYSVTINGTARTPPTNSAIVTAWPPTYGVTDLGNGGRQYPPFFAAKTAEIPTPSYTTGPPLTATGVTCTWGSASNTPFCIYGSSLKTCTSPGAPLLPVILDHYPDPLPILYFRKTSVDTPLWALSPGDAGLPAPPAPPTAPPANSYGPAGRPAGTNGAAFYQNCNQEFTDTTGLCSPSGVAFNETLGDLCTSVTYYGSYTASNSNPLLIPTFQGDVSNSSQSGPAGGYVLIAAGPSRIYGSTQNMTTGTAIYNTDNIVLPGGQ